MAFLLDLPPEILNQIIDHLGLAQNAKSLTMVNRAHYRVFNDLVYIIDMELRGGFGALRAISKDLHTAVGKFLDLGSGTKFAPALVKRSNILHVAAYYGAVFTVKLLLERQAHPQEQDEMGRTPLYFALKYRHGEVIKTLSEAISDISNVFIDHKKSLTPLHGACMEKLPMAAKLFLELGDDIHAKDAEALTPLLHTLRPSGRAVTGCQNDEVFDVLMILREFGLDISLVDWDFSNGAPISSLELGAKHQNSKVRELFGQKELPGPNNLKKAQIFDSQAAFGAMLGSENAWFSKYARNSVQLLGTLVTI
ncbi:ankyrin repeat domain-containing protein [Aspergillus lucknowensis]|uniref:Ankyrin repeat-containing domain protein n=1 Tax=Aspergillus lucknowensis TaxID=176173 RepID=A0ABR4L916_9EURO